MTCREFRREHGYILEDVAAKTGFSISGISKWERGIDDMPIGFVEKMKEAFGIDIERQTKFVVFKKTYYDALAEKDRIISELEKRITQLENEKKVLETKLSKILKISEE